MDSIFNDNMFDFDMEKVAISLRKIIKALESRTLSSVARHASQKGTTEVMRRRHLRKLKDFLDETSRLKKTPAISGSGRLGWDKPMSYKQFKRYSSASVQGDSLLRNKFGEEHYYKDLKGIVAKAQKQIPAKGKLETSDVDLFLDDALPGVSTYKRSAERQLRRDFANEAHREALDKSRRSMDYMGYRHGLTWQ